MSCLILTFFSQTITTTLDISYDIGRIQTLDFSVMSNNTLGKWCKKIGFCYWIGLKIQVCQQFDVDIVPHASNFIKNETAAQMVSGKHCFLQ